VYLDSPNVLNDTTASSTLSREQTLREVGGAQLPNGSAGSEQMTCTCILQFTSTFCPEQPSLELDPSLFSRPEQG
jgi:hypothetical protein